MSRNILFLLVAICCSTESFHFRKSKTTIYEVDHEADVGSPLFLTLFLQRGMYKKAQQLSKVNPDIGNMTSYSGLFTVNKECNSNLYFWFFPAQKPNWQEAPLVLWLQGGPGESSLFGLFTELGPFEVFDKNLRKREYSWNVENNLLFIDQPVGAGFSFTGKECYPENETAVGADLYEALVQFYQLFPVLQKNKFFITGESYAGHYIPALGYTIHKNNPSAKVKINLAAMMIGNGWMDPVSQIDYGSYLYQHGLIDDSVKEVYKSQQELFVKQVESENFDAATATCKGFTGHLFDRFVGNVSVYNLLLPDTEDDNWAKFLNSSEIRKALHVGNLTYYSYSRVVSSHLEWDQVQSVKPWVEELLEYYPMIFYNGQLDIICAYPMMINFLQSLSWEGDAAYLNATRTKWCVGNELAGYYKGTRNLYDVLVRAAGHMVPADQSHWAYVLVNSVTSGPSDNPLHALTAC